MTKLKLHTPDFTEANIAKIAELFPQCLTETTDGNGDIKRAIDFDLLKQELSNSIVEGTQERYQLNWVGKKEALLTANAPIVKTLRPCRAESVDFDSTQNLYIEGDNLYALKLLQETYLNQVKMIYIDPPYNTGNDFIYEDDFAEDTESYKLRSNQTDEDGNRLISNTESNGRFHSDWLSMMYSRLRLARNLLRDDGIIFISIDDNEVHNLRKICDEIFGADNFIGCAARVTKKSNNKGEFWAPNFDYVLSFTKNKSYAKEFFGGANIEAYNQIETEGSRKGEKYQLVRLYMSSIKNRNPDQRFYIECPDGSKVIPPGKTFPPERPNLGDGIWRWTRRKIKEDWDKIVIKEVKSSNLVDENRNPAKYNVFTKTYLNDVIANSSAKPNSLIENFINQMSSHELNDLKIPFDYAKPSKLIHYLLKVAQTGEQDIILDFFSGSATTAHAVMQLNAEDGGNRKFIMVQLSEPCDEKSEAYKTGYKTIPEIGKERIRRAGQKIKTEKTPDLDIGFRVLKIDDSNMNKVYYSPDSTKQSDLLNWVDNIRHDRNDEDLLFQVLLDWGIDLTLPITSKTIDEKTVFTVANNEIVACFDRQGGITEDFIKELAKQKPLRVVFCDSGFADDSVKINIEQVFKSLSPQTEIKTI